MLRNFLHFNLNLGLRLPFGTPGTGEQPVPADMPEVKGIYVGGCIGESEGISLLLRGKVVHAHAHIYNTPLTGWICFCCPIEFTHPDFAYVRWHEYAHILANQGHTDKWRQIMTELGQPIPACYARRKRRVSA